MLINPDTKEIIVSQYDYGAPVLFQTSTGFQTGDKIKFTFANDAIANKVYTVDSNSYYFSLKLSEGEALLIFSEDVPESGLIIPYSVKHERPGVFLDTIVNSKLIVKKTVQYGEKENYVVDLENRLRNMTIHIAQSYDVCNERGANMPEIRNSENLPATINTIPAYDNRKVFFYDYDGTVLYNYTKNKINDMTELPTPPAHDGLTFTGWSWDLQNIKYAVNNIGGIVNVGALYRTTDGKTRFYIQIDSANDTTFKLYLTQSAADSVLVDWGDGSEPETLGENEYIGYSGGRFVYSTTHEYEPSSYPATYTITFSKTGNATYGFGVANYWAYAITDNRTAIRRIEFAEDVDITGAFCYGQYCLKSIAGDILPGNRSSFAGCYKISFVSCSGAGESTFSGCRDLITVSIPPDNDNNINIGNCAFSDCSRLKNIGTILKVGSIGNYAFYRCQNLTNVYFGNIPTLIDYWAFKECPLLENPIYAPTIGHYAFNGSCFQSSRLTIPSYVEEIESSAFSSNRALRVIDLTAFTNPNNLPQLDDSSAFPYWQHITTFIVANQEMLTAFSNATNWSAYADYYVIES